MDDPLEDPHVIDFDMLMDRALAICFIAAFVFAAFGAVSIVIDEILG